MAAAAVVAGAGYGGRAAVRSGEARPGGLGGDVAVAQRAMEGLAVGGGGSRVGGQTRRRGALLFIQEPHTRPSHITDKRG